ncbi:YeeE/YedE family protein [Pseudogulbenkiania subflava]|uniref:Uncharacterized protein n=1 Tax=Pseudogulbenkiania subflava DSM 22618 TaxID=1123014 RepID=A0A1Y6C3P0_9NEIS|nr:YeeE/YedE family protein [Pseudogulbenkiania subflava]SMF35595.1 hypothetical protein SAMN02745746_02731 [Pseudogulbenkiania subflava DSM 22618]
MIDWNHFTPLASLAGGVLIGLAASWLVLANGRIAGISGLLGGLVDRAADWRGRAAFIAGLVLAPLLYRVLAGDMPSANVTAAWPQLALAGLLVGVGTRYASGCTSGHGVCGLARLSPRSLVATLSFMAAGFGTVYLLRHVLA